jgi:nucleoside-diphosphate-sugar epimerase
VVCHCAAKLPGTAPPEEIWRVNVDGSANLIAACVENRVRRVVFVSTDSVYGDTNSAAVTEDSPLNPEYLYEGNYPRSKLAGENIAIKAASAHGIEVVILRPCLMYGPGDSAGTRLLQQWAARRVHPLIGGGLARISLAFVADAAECIALAAEKTAPSSRIYNISGGAYTKREILETISEITGRRAAYLPIPAKPLFPAMSVLGTIVKPFGPRASARFDTRRISFSIGHHMTDSERARRELGFEPRISLREGLRQTLAADSGKWAKPY